MVKVRLMEKSVKSHVGRVIVEKVMIQYRRLGITWKKTVNSQPSQPDMVEGVGAAVGGGGRWEFTEATEKLAVREGEREKGDDGGDSILSDGTHSTWSTRQRETKGGDWLETWRVVNKRELAEGRYRRS